MKVAHIFSDDYTSYNSSNFRATIPFNALKEAGADVFLLPIREWAKGVGNPVFDLTLHCDAVIIQRVLLLDAVPLMDTLQRSGVKVFVDFDDSYDKIREDNAAYNFWGKGVVEIGGVENKLSVHPIDQFKSVLMRIDGFMASSPLLVSDWSSFAKGYYIPNFIDSKNYTSERAIGHSIGTKGLPVVGWGGSLSHVDSFTGSGAISALRKLSAEGKIQVAIFGDKRIVDLLAIKDVVYMPYCRFYEWGQRVNSIDVGIAPLFGDYDCRRSRLKMIELQACGKPVVATMAQPYKDVLSPKESTFFVDQGSLDLANRSNPDGWYQAILKAVSSDSTIAARNFREQAIAAYDASANKDVIFNLFKEALND